MAFSIIITIGSLGLICCVILIEYFKQVDFPENNPEGMKIKVNSIDDVRNNPLKYFDYEKVINEILLCFTVWNYNADKDDITSFIDEDGIGNQLLDSNLNYTILKLCSISSLHDLLSDDAKENIDLGFSTLEDEIRYNTDTCGGVISNDGEWVLSVTEQGAARALSSWQEALRLKAEAHEISFRAKYNFLSHK